MESLLKTLWRRLRFYLIDWGLIARRGIFYIGGSDTLPPPLEREKEAELIARMDEGDESVRGTLIEHNLRLVAYIARRFENTGINIEDLISIGTIGLIKAVNTYRSDKNIKLAVSALRIMRYCLWNPQRIPAALCLESCLCLWNIRHFLCFQVHLKCKLINRGKHEPAFGFPVPSLSKTSKRPALLHGKIKK